MTKLERYPIKGAGAMKGQLVIRRRSWIDATPVIWFYKRILSPFGVEHPKAAAGIARLRRQPWAMGIRRNHDHRQSYWRRWIG